MSGINGRMLDESAYSTETLNTFGFISQYFVDLFYNRLYFQAIRFFRNKEVKTVTDGYLLSLDSFLQQINNDDSKLYRELVYGIYNTFQTFGFKGISYQNCIDKITKEFTPSDYWSVLSADDKSELLTRIINVSCNAMIKKIINQRLSDVIDNHNNAENGNEWQDDFIQILSIEREKMYHEFINVKTNNGGGGGNNKFIDGLKEEITRLIKDKKIYLEENNTLKKKLLDDKKVIVELFKKIKKYEIIIEELQKRLTSQPERQISERQISERQNVVQSIEQVVQPIVQPTKQPTEQPTKQPIEQPTEQSDYYGQDDDYYNDQEDEQYDEHEQEIEVQPSNKQMSLEDDLLYELE
jgi:hypothetical protein